MNYEQILENLKNHIDSEYKVEYKDEDWWELYEDQTIRMLYKYEIRIAGK